MKRSTTTSINKMSDQQSVSEGLALQNEVQIDVENQPPTTGSAPIDQLIQQQLILLLHCQKCQIKEREFQHNGEIFHCNVLHCNTIKGVLNHMTTCRNSMDCPFAHCSSSRPIIRHWKSCIRIDCVVCGPLRQNLYINEQKKVCQRYIVVLVHATECQRRESEGNDQILPCNLPDCKATKVVLNHLTTCENTNNCNFSNCCFTRQVMNHWKNCSRDPCPMCLPLKENSINNPNATLNPPQMEESPDTDLFDMIKAYDLLNIR